LCCFGFVLVLVWFGCFDLPLTQALTCHPNYIIPVIPVFYVMHVSFKNTFFEKEAQAM
jgi:hypothetical protein